MCHTCYWGAGFLAGGGEGESRSPCLWFSGGLPEWGHLAHLGLGSGCSGPFGSLVGFVWRLFPGCTIVLEGIV